ncbi:unnamed protein product [Urochloa humidicola]
MRPLRPAPVPPRTNRLPLCASLLAGEEGLRQRCSPVGRSPPAARAPPASSPAAHMTKAADLQAHAHWRWRKRRGGGAAAGVGASPPSARRSRSSAAAPRPRSRRAHLLLRRLPSIGVPAAARALPPVPGAGAVRAAAAPEAEVHAGSGSADLGAARLGSMAGGGLTGRKGGVPSLVLCSASFPSCQSMDWRLECRRQVKRTLTPDLLREGNHVHVDSVLSIAQHQLSYGSGKVVTFFRERNY